MTGQALSSIHYSTADLWDAMHAYDAGVDHSLPVATWVAGWLDARAGFPRRADITDPNQAGYNAGCNAGMVAAD